MANETRGRKPRITLDGQLVSYWDREAARLDALEKNATFRWLARGYARKAERARALADKSRAKEIARGNLDPAPEQAGTSDSA